MYKYKGKVCLVVNVASRLIAPTSIEGIGCFPSNDFGAQEPNTEVEIKQFCSTRYDVTFDMLAKVAVQGPIK